MIQYQQLNGVEHIHLKTIINVAAKESSNES
jgi:hypothetical protein